MAKFEPHKGRLPGDPLPSYDELLQRVEKMEAALATTLPISSLPVRALQEKLEQDWQPNPGVLLPPSSVSSSLLAPSAATLAKTAPAEGAGHVRGSGTGDSGSIAPAGMPVTITDGVAMTLSITPSTNCWWPVGAGALVRTPDAAWRRLVVRLLLTPADADGVNVFLNDIDHNVGAADWIGAPVAGTFKLTAGVSYTCAFQFEGATGNFIYFRGSNRTFIHSPGAHRR
jgi:hypothetical protein